MGLMTVRRHRARLTTALHLAEVRHNTSLVVGRADAAEAALRKTSKLLRGYAQNYRDGCYGGPTDRADEYAACFDHAADLVYTPPPRFTAPVAPTSQES